MKFDSTKFPLTLTAGGVIVLVVMNDLSLLKRYIGFIATPIAAYTWNAQNNKVIPYGYDYDDRHYRIHMKNTHSASITIEYESDLRFYIMYLI